MKSEWKTTTLNDVCTCISGLWTGKKEPFTRIGVLRNTNFTKDCHLNFSDIAYIDVESKALEKKTLCIGDIIIEKSGGGPRQPVGRAVLFAGAKEPFSFSNFTSALRIRDSLKKDICPEFLQKYLLWFYLSGQTEPMQKFATGIRNLDMKQYLKINFSYPPLSEQKRIVGILDAAFEKIDKIQHNAERNLKNAKELFQQVLDEEMTPKEGWISSELQNAVDKNCSLSYGIVQPGDEKSDGIPVVRPVDLGKRTIGSKGLKRISPDISQSYRRTLLKGEEILLCVRGETGIVSMASKELAGANVTRGIVPIFFDKQKINQTFGYYLMMSPFVYLQIKKKTTGTALKQINIGDLRQIQVSYPNHQIQDKIVEILEKSSAALESLNNNFQQIVKSSTELKQQILAKAFNGEL